MQKNWTERLSVFGRALQAAFAQSFGRFTLWLMCHGIMLPWCSWAETTVSAPTLDRYRRRALVSRLRVQRYRINRGPYFLRATLDGFFAGVRFLQFPILLLLKVIAALCLCMMPFVIFFAIRVYLPVPQRIAQQVPALNEQLLQSAEAVVPDVTRIAVGEPLEFKEFISPTESADAFFSFKELDPRTGEGQLVQGSGTAHRETRRGWFLSPKYDLLFKFSPSATSRNLRLRFRPIPSNDQAVQCKLKIVSDLGQVVFATTFDSFASSRNLLLKSPLTRTLQEKLMPDFALTRATLPSLPVSLMLGSGESHFRFRLERLDGQSSDASCSALLHGFEWSGRKATRTSSGHDKSLLFLLFDSMNADVVSDPNRMNWLSGFLRSPRTLSFLQHHSVDVRQNQSFKMLMGVSGAGENPSPTEKTSRIEKLRSSGYRIISVGAFDEADARSQPFVPDLEVKIDNATYEPRLVLSQLFNVISEEGTAPLFIVVRMKGLSGEWRPYFSDLNFRDLFLGGSSRGGMDALIFSHLKTLDKELAYHMSALERSGVFKRMDLVVTAERGFDLGINLARRDLVKPTFTPDLLVNEDTLRVPLGVSLAGQTDIDIPAFAKNRNIISSHIDLMRTLWDGFNLKDVGFPADAHRLWNRSEPFASLRSRSALAASESDSSMRMIWVRSKLQEGVLFTDPDSAGGFIKYVSQPLPSRLVVPDAYGFSEKLSLTLPAGEQFKQVSKRGQKEEVIGRVNNRYVREARRVVRQERRFPLRLRITAHSEQKIDLLFEEKSQGSSSLLPVLRHGLQVQSLKSDPQTYIHRLTGTLSKGEFFDLKGSGHLFRIVESKAENVLVACPEAYVFSPLGLSSALSQKTVCLLESPDPERLAHLKDSGKKVLSFWLVEDENQVCKLQEDVKSDTQDYLECLEAAPHSDRRE